MSSPRVRSRWDLLTVTAAIVALAVVALVLRALSAWPGLRVAGRDWTDGVVVAVLVGVAVVLFTARDHWRELRETLAAREAAEHQARILFESSPLPMWVFDVETLKVLDVNDAAVRSYGWGREEFLRMDLRDLRPPEEVPQLLALLHNAPEVLRSRLVRHRRKDGSTFMAEAHSIALVYRGHRARLSVLEDITARKRAEDELRRSEAEFRAMSDASPTGVVMATAGGQVGYANETALTMLGLPFEECLDRGWVRAIHPDDRERVVKGWMAAAEAVQPFTTTGRFLRPDGSVIWWRVRTSPIRTDDKVLGQVGVLIDETEQRLAQEALRESEARFRQFAEKIPGVVYLIGPHHDHDEVLFVSPGYETIWGRTCASLIAGPRSFLEGVHPEDRSRVEQAYTERHGRLDIEYRVMRPDGKETWVADLQFPIHRSDGRVYVIAGLVFDVTDRKRLEEQLMQSQKMESLGRLAGGVAHDFNNLLTIIIAYADLLKEVAAGDETLVSGLNEIEAAGGRASALTRQLLSFARRQIFDPRVIDVNQVTAGIEQMLGRLIREDVHMDVRLAASPSHIKADPHQMEQVVINLTLNARYAMPRGGTLTLATGNVRLTEVLRATPADVPPGEYVTITVSDTGTGIPADLLGKIFEPFFTTKPKGEGAGLGLSTSYGIVAQFGGSLALSSEVGKGTTVTCFMPPVDVVPETVAAQSAAPAKMAGTETLLIAEDEDMVRDVARRTLERHGYVVLTARDGVDGLRVAAAHPGTIDLLVTDVVMPHKGGRELADELTRVRPEVRVLFTSGYNQELAGHEGRLEAGLEFLPKPYLPGALAQRVRQILDAEAK